MLASMLAMVRSSSCASAGPFVRSHARIGEQILDGRTPFLKSLAFGALEIDAVNPFEKHSQVVISQGTFLSHDFLEMVSNDHP